MQNLQNLHRTCKTCVGISTTTHFIGCPHIGTLRYFISKEKKRRLSHSALQSMSYTILQYILICAAVHAICYTSKYWALHSQLNFFFASFIQYARKTEQDISWKNKYIYISSAFLYFITDSGIAVVIISEIINPWSKNYIHWSKKEQCNKTSTCKSGGRFCEIVRFRYSHKISPTLKSEIVLLMK